MLLENQFRRKHPEQYLVVTMECLGQVLDTLLPRECISLGMANSELWSAPPQIGVSVLSIEAVTVGRGYS